MMLKPSEEQLMRYADQTLDATEQAAVEAHLETDAEARDLVERLRLSAALSRELFNANHEPVPQAMIDRVLHGSSTVVAMPQRTARRSMARFALPMAAAIAMCVTGLGAYWLAQPQVDGAVLALGDVQPGSGLADMLENLPSGRVMPADPSDGGYARALVLSTFRDRDNRPCREFEVLTNDALPRASLGIACRTGAQQWQIYGAVELSASMIGSDGTFVPSSDHNDDPLAEVFTMIGAGPQLPASDEAALLAGSWK